MNPTTPEPAHQPLAVEAGAPLPRRNPAGLPPALAEATAAGTATAHAQEDALPAALAAEMRELPESWEAEADDVTPDIVVGTDVLWFDIETGKTDPTHGKVFQILADQADAFPIVVRWADGALFRHTRNELRVVTA